MPLLAAEFVQATQAAATRLFLHARIDVSILRQTRVNIRIELNAERFIDIFFREETGRTDFALIVGGQRIFGLDNLGGWHRHSFDDPTQHIPCAEPTPEDALRQIKQVVDTLT